MAHTERSTSESTTPATSKDLENLIGHTEMPMSHAFPEGMLQAAAERERASVSNSFEGFCRDAEQAIADVLANGQEHLIGLAGEHEAKWHPNGFVVFELGPLSPGFLRLHMWPAGPRQLRDAGAHVHTHVWDLCSRVLVGTYQERMYDAALDHGEGGRLFRTARIDYVRDRNTLVESAESRLREAETVIARSGELHTIQAGVAHETLIADGMFVATLLIVSPHRLNEVLVYSHDFLRAAEHTRAALSLDDRDNLLGELQERLVQRGEG